MPLQPRKWYFELDLNLLPLNRNANPLRTICTVTQFLFPTISGNLNSKVIRVRVFHLFFNFFFFSGKKLCLVDSYELELNYVAKLITHVNTK